MSSLVGEMDLWAERANDVGVSDIIMPNILVQGGIAREESMPKKNALLIFEEARELAKEKGISFHTPKFEISLFECNNMNRRSYITWGGKAFSFPLEKYAPGDICQKPFFIIWNGRGMRTLREQYNREGLERTCPNCSCWDNRPEAFLSLPENSRGYAEVME